MWLKKLPGDPRANLAAAAAELQRRRWANDPAAWVRERCHGETWWAQREILNLIRKNRYVAVQSANGIGKTKLAAFAACWWLDTHLPGDAFVLTSAATAEQVRTRLWKEIHIIHEAGNLPGRLNQVEWIMQMPPYGRSETVALGVKPADNDPDALKGIHAPAVLVIFDEAQAMDRPLWAAARTLITSEQSCFLAIGNPDDPLTRFAEVCKPDSGWAHIALSAYDSPNFFTAFLPGTFKGEKMPKRALASLVSHVSVIDLINEWGIDHPFYVSQVLGQFPEISTDTLIPLSWIRRAQRSQLAVGVPVELGCDVGGGVASSTMIVRRGGVAEIYWNKQTPETSEVVDKLIWANRDLAPAVMKVDAVGIGNNVASMAVSGMITDGHGQPIVLPVEPINVGGSARDKDNYGDLRAEGFWHLRELFRTNAIRIPAGTPEAERLAGELADIKYRSLGGRIRIESKDEMKARGRKSPDLADALMLAFLDPPIRRKVKLTWGKKRAATASTSTPSTRRRGYGGRRRAVS